MGSELPIFSPQKPIVRGKRVLLINPPSPFLMEERVFAPTGILYAAAELEQQGVRTDVLDLARYASAADKDREYADIVSSYERDYLSQVRAAAPGYDCIGVSATTPQYKFVAKILDEIRAANPQAKTVLGGAHATMVSGLRSRMIEHLRAIEPGITQDEAALEARLHEFDPNFRSVGKFDHVVAGSPSGLLAVLGGLDQQWVASAKLGRNLDGMPLPARDKIDLLSYRYSLRNPRTGEVVPTTNVMSQWGCPFPCNFCSGRDDDFYRTVRMRSPEKTIEELDALHEQYGVKGFMFFDDELNVVPQRFHNLLVLLKERHVSRGYVYRGFVKSELIVERSPDTFDRMVDAGFAEACTGVESGSNRILEHVIRKGTTPEINLRCAQLARESGISFKAFTMLGHPYETEQDVRATHEWLLHARPTGFDVTVHQPYPGAPVYDFAVKDERTGVFFLTEREVDLARQRQFTHGSRIEDAVFFFEKADYADAGVDTFYKGRPGEYQSNVWTPWLSRRRVVELRDYMEADVRRKLGNGSVSGISYDGAMGQAGAVITGEPTN